jgi:hypothetical protein
MTKAELAALEAILSTPTCSLHALPPAAAVRLAMQTRGYSLTAAQNVATLYGAAPALVAEVRRLRAICAATLPVMETAIRAGLDNFSTAEENEIIASHATVKALRSALASPAAE